MPNIHHEHTTTLRKKKRSIKLLIVSFLSFLFLIASILFIPPTQSIQLANYTISFIYPFLFMIFLFLLSFGTYVFHNPKHGLLLGLFVIVYLCFRLNNLTHPFFLIMLVALFLILELLFTYKRGE